jgi:hypothetical protein
VASIEEILRQASIDLVQTWDGQVLGGGEFVKLGEKVKSVYLDGRSVLLVRRTQDGGTGAPWEACPMEYLKKHY